MGILPTDKFPLLIVLNPHSGKKEGREVLQTIVQPALSQAGKPFKVIESTAQGHAQSYFSENIKPIIIDLAQSLGTVDDADGVPTQPKSATLQIMVLGGDGTVHEIVNGILQGVEGSAFVSDEFRPNVEFSIIPTGTGNAISTSLGVTGAQDALERFLTGKPVPLRLMSVSTRASVESHWKPHVYTVVVNSYGLHCATVYDSEEFRHLGNERFRQAAMKNIENLKQYEGKLDLVGPVQAYDRTQRSLATLTTQGDKDNGDTTSLPGPFTYLLITKQASLEPGFTPTPFASTSDEWMDILAVQNAGQSELLQMFGATATGQHVDQEKIEYFKAKAIELEIPESLTKGRLCVDGEFLTINGGPQGRVRFEVTTDANTQFFSVFV
jgi:diacylglycerol kinase family enzyme